MGLHSNLITKRLKSCVNRFYSFVNVKVIFQNSRPIKSFFSYKDRLSRSRLSKVIYKASCWDCNDFYIRKTKRRLHEPAENGTFQGRPFRNMITLLQLQITLKQLVTTSNGTILTLWRPARLTITVKLRRLRLFKSYSQHWMPMSAVHEKLLLPLQTVSVWNFSNLFAGVFCLGSRPSLLLYIKIAFQKSVTVILLKMYVD